MSAAQGLIPQIESTRKFFKNTLSVFTEEDSGFAPNPELYTVAEHVAHVADTIDWFIEGAFGDGWDMDFEAQIAKAKAISASRSAVPSNRPAQASSRVPKLPSEGTTSAR